MIKKILSLLPSILIIFILNISSSQAEEATIENLENKIKKLEVQLFNILNVIDSGEYGENKIGNKTKTKKREFKLTSSGSDITITPVNNTAPGLNQYRYSISPNGNWSIFKKGNNLGIIEYKNLYNSLNQGKYLVIQIKDLTDQNNYLTHKLGENQNDLENLRSNGILDSFETEDGGLEKPIVEITEVNNNFECEIETTISGYETCIMSGTLITTYKIESVNTGITITGIYGELSGTGSEKFIANNTCYGRIDSEGEDLEKSCLIKIENKDDVQYIEGDRYNFLLNIKYDDNLIIQKGTRNWRVKGKIIDKNQ